MEKGFTVHGTGRDIANAAKFTHVTSLPGADARLKLFEADLLKEGSFDEALKGCDGVFHVASPFKMFVENPKEQLIRPAVEGTQNVLRACLHSPSVKHVVLTSSVVTVVVGNDKADPNYVFSEEDVADPEVQKSMEMWYPTSKVLAETKAWDFMRSHPEAQFALDTVLPGLILGTPLDGKRCQSHEYVLGLMLGQAPFVPSECTHCDDVAKLHLAVYEQRSGGSRNIAISSNHTEEEFIEALAAVAKVVRQGAYGQKKAISMAASEQLSVKTKGLQEIVAETVA